MKSLTLEDLLSAARERGASDLHLVPDAPPVLRVGGHLINVDGLPALSGQEIYQLVDALMVAKGLEAKWRLFPVQLRELDVGLLIDFGGRARGNVFLAGGEVAAAFRLIPSEIPTIEELRLPAVTHRLIDRPKGLLIVTGPTGSGKSTTLAALLEAINQRHRRRILTIEDPIEYSFAHGQSLVSQREVGRDTLAFTDALRAALREDPDVLLVGEMRDLETMQTAITAAESGHLVLTTLHTIDAASTVDRILDVFPPIQQPQIRTQLSEALLAVLAQQLVATMDPNFGARPELRGRVLACEVLLGPMADVMAVRTQIREGGKNLYTTMETGAERGMQTMETALAELVHLGLVSADTAERVSVRQTTLQALLEHR